MDKDLLKEYITKNRDLIDNYQVVDVYKNIHGYLGQRGNIDAGGEAFSYICSGWIKCGYNPLEKMEFVPSQYFTHITASKVVIPGNIQSIRSHAFLNAKLDTVTIGPSVRYIADYAFDECDINLVNIESPAIEIDNFAFRHSSIKKIIIPRSAYLHTYWCQKSENAVDSIFQIGV